MINDQPYSELQKRQRWMGVLARASANQITTQLKSMPALPTHAILRGPEVGLVMVRGRQGGDGGPFNLGEMTVTRCSVRLADGSLGHAYVAGRDQTQAELAALLDACLQQPELHDALLTEIIEPLAEMQAEAAALMARKAAATKVEFFTMANMR